MVSREMPHSLRKKAQRTDSLPGSSHKIGEKAGGSAAEQSLKSTQVTLFIYLFQVALLQKRQRGKALNKNVGRAVSGTVVGW